MKRRTKHSQSSSWSPGRSLTSWLGGAMRAAFALGVIVSLACFGWLGSAKAQVGESLRGFGAELLSWQSARLHSAPRRLRLNGLELNLVTLSRPGDVKSTLDHFHESCRKHGGLVLGPAEQAKLGISSDGTFRQESEDEGVLACLDTGRPLAVGELLERLQRFTETGDLASVGELRYVMARRDGKRTTALALWTDGSAPLVASFPKTGDAPGIDPVGVPRMHGTRRLLSAAEEPLPYSMNIYAVDGQAASGVLAWYKSALVAEGWTVEEARQGALTARRGDRSLLLRATTASNGRGTTVSLAELS